MEYIYALILFISFLIGVLIGLKLPFISDKLGKVIIRENQLENNNSQSITNLTSDLIDEWQNGVDMNE